MSLPAQSRGGWRPSIDFVVLLFLLAACALGGGSAFTDTVSLLYVRPLALAALASFLVTPARAEWRAVRVPAVLLGLWAMVILIQLVPLPPAIWLSLPGRAIYAGAAAGAAQPWRPLSLTPDLTANSLAALIIPAAVLAGFAKLGEEQRHWLVVALIGLCVASAALGIAQFASGEDSALYFYKRSHFGFPAGLLANRNHQAALLALIFPALRVWTLWPALHQDAERRRLWIALALGAMMVPVILATGSRSGMVVAAASLAITFLVFSPARDTAGRLLRWGVPAVAVLLVGISYMLGRAASIERISSMAVVEDDQRFRFAPVVIDIIRQTFPVGTGLGSFDPAFRQYEPDSILIASYFNHAHNELLELAMTAGLAGLLLLAALIGWLTVCIMRALRTSAQGGQTCRYVLLGGIVVAALLGASLTDYPLRTPLMSAVFAVACGWLGSHQKTRVEIRNPMRQ